MMRISIFLFLFLSFFVSSSYSVKVCDALRCRREGSGGKIRLGHRPIQHAEVPYLSVLLYNNDKPPHRPYCLGVLIKVRHNQRGYTTEESVTLTTCACAHRETKSLIGIGSSQYGTQVAHLRTYTIRLWLLGASCRTTNTDDPNDFAYILTHDRLPSNLEQAYFKSSSMDIYDNYIDSLMKNHESECFGFGYGGYEFMADKWGPLEKEGKMETSLHIYDYRLITDEECGKWVPKCCGKWSDIGAKKGTVKQSQLHCAIRNMPSSVCYGNVGSPIICDGYLIGFLKGHLKCSPDSKSYAGPDLYVPIGTKFEFSEIMNQFSRSFVRPKPPFFEDSVRELELEEDFRSSDGNDTTTGGNTTNTKKKPKSEEDYYYDFATPNFFSQSLPTLIITTIILEFIRN